MFTQFLNLCNIQRAMKRSSGDSSKRPSKRFRCASFLDRVRTFFQWLPGVADLVTPSPEYPLPPTQAWSRTCPDHSLRCPACGQYLEAPVKQCVNGHSLCLKCRRSLANCPTCRGHFLRTPQPVLDRLLSTTRLPCLYAAFGCPVLEVLRRRESHSRLCSYRPSICPLCSWETPPPSRPQDRADQATGEQLLAQHMTSAHKHHALQLNEEHVFFAWLDFEKQKTAFLSCAISVNGQVFVFVMNHDTKRRKFFVVLKHIGPVDKERSLKSRSETLSSKSCEYANDSEKPQMGLNDPQDFRQDIDVPIEKQDSFERTKGDGIFRVQPDCDYCYLVELGDSKGVQSVRLVQTALSQEDALDIAVKSGRCLSIDSTLLERLLEPGNGRFTVRITISNVEDSMKKKASLKQNLYQTNAPEDSAIM